jgi:peptide/nickel transport system permease protein
VTTAPALAGPRVPAPPGEAGAGDVHARLRDLTLSLARRSRLFRAGLVLVGINLVLAVIGPWIAPKPLIGAVAAPSLPPSGDHWFGTDPSGLDVFSRVIAAPRIDITVAVFSTVIAVVLGTAIGLTVGFFHGVVGEVVMRALDTLQALPGVLLVLIVVLLSGQGTLNIVLILGTLTVPLYVRLVRAEVLSLRELPFVEAAVANGGSRTSVAVRHVLPNALTPALALSTVTMGYALLAVTGLSFVGAGVRPPAAEWGGMISAGANGIGLGQWWMSVFPGAAISLSVFGFAVVGEGFQRVLGRRM